MQEATELKAQPVPTTRHVPERFLVAFSFAGEQRELVRAVAEFVESKLGSDTVFLDEWFDYYIAGADADLKLQRIYGERCELVVVCVSKHYGGKPWTQAEHEAVRARLMKARNSTDERERDRILPIRVGDGDVDGILFNNIVPDIRGQTVAQAAELIIKRLRLFLPDPPQPIPNNPLWVDRDAQWIPNLSSTIGSIHVHIDGGEDRQLAKRCTKLIDPEESRSEIAQVTQFVEGPQRNDLKDIYAEHTPTKSEKESLEFVSTTVLHKGDPEPRDGKLAEIEDKVRLVLGDISAELQRMRRDPGGIVVEAERVVGLISENGKACWAEKISLPTAFGPAFTFKKKHAFSSSRLYEVHFVIDILGKSEVDELPIPLSDLVEASAQANIRVGGWFTFWNPKKWAYRSNMFLQHLDQDRIRLDWERLNEQVRGIDVIDRAKVNVRVIVEESLGVWKAPFEKVDPESLTVPELAAWENSLQPGTTFWVVTGNFLGDQHEAVRHAMLRNFGVDIKYVFFLQSFADLARWQRFRYDLEKEYRGVASKMDAFVIEFEHLEIWTEKLDCFIAQGGDNPEGYKLTRDPYNKNIIRGTPLAHEKINAINELLEPVMKRGAIVSTLHVVENRFIDGTVIWLDFGYFDIIKQKKPNESDLAQFVSDYDGEIAADISKCGGEVMRSSEMGLVVILEDNSRGKDSEIVERTFRLARAMLDLLERKFRSIKIDSTPHRLVLDYGSMYRFIRSSGRAIAGDLLRRCRCKAAVLNPGRNVALSGIQTILAQAESPWLGILSRINDDEFGIDLSKDNDY